MPTDALVSQEAPSLVNGISLQPSHQRLSSQAQEQTNIISDVSFGVEGRPPTEHTKLLEDSAAGASPTGGYFHHVINRGSAQRFEVLIKDQDIFVYDLSDGSEVTVNDGGALGSPGSYNYLDINTGAGETAKNSFEAITVADFTFILNKRKVAVMSGSPSGGRTKAHEFILFLKLIGTTFAGSKISMKFGATTFTSTHGSSNPGDVEKMMEFVCVILTGQVFPDDRVGLSDEILDWKFTRIGNTVLHGYQFQNANHSVSVTDTSGDALFTFSGTGTAGEDPTVASFSDLPKTAIDDFVIKVKGDDGSEEDEYYIKYIAEEKIWKEWVRPALDDAFDADFLPHALVYNEGTGQFSFEPLAFVNRLVGDADSALEPSFIGNTISDIVSHRGRLAFVSDENVILSERGELFNFWPTTVTTTVDSDPIDIAGTGDRVSIWDFAVPYRGALSLFSSVGDTIAEMLGSSNENLTLKNARVEERAAYAITAVRPVTAADSIYFILEHGVSSVVFQYASTDVDIFNAVDITAHVAGFLPASIFKVAPGRAESIFCYLSSATGERNNIYVYRFHFVGTDQVMASWSKWVFADNDVILNVDWIESILYLTIERQDGIHFEKIDLGKKVEDAVLGYRVHLDGLISVTGSFDAPTDLTSWTIPYDQATNGGTYRIVKGGDWGTERGAVITIDDASVDLVIKAIGNHSANAVYIGRDYTRTYELSQIHLRDTQTRRTTEGGTVSGRLQLRKGRLSYFDTGTFEVEILSKDDSDSFSQVFTSQFINEAVIGPAVLDTGVFEFAIGADSRSARIVFSSSSFLPFAFSAFEWDGRFVQRATRA